MASDPESPTSPSVGFNTDQLPHTHTSRASEDDEASVDPDIVRDEIEEQPEEEEDGEDLYNDNFLDDYKRMDEADQFESFGLDDSLEDDRDFDQIMQDRRAAEIELEARDGRASNRNKLPQLLHDQDTDDDNHRSSKRARADFRPSAASDDDLDGMQSSPGRSQRGHPREDVLMTDQTEDDRDDDDFDDGYEMYHVQGTLREWVTRDEVRRFIARKFKDFLLTYVNPKNEHRDKEYVWLINEMVSASKCSLEIDYKQFIYVHPNIAIWLADAPQSVLEVMEDVTKSVVFELHPNYRNIHQKIYVRITNLPVYDQIRNIRQIHLNTMIRIGGVVTRRSGVFPQLQQVKYDCNKCGAILGPFFQNSYSEVKVGSCPECQSKGPFTVNIEQTIYRNFQKLTLQESPGIVPAGRLPRYKEEVTGVYTNNFDLSLNTKNGFPVFATVVEANYVTKKQDLFSAYKLTQEDIEEIENLAKDPRIGERDVVDPVTDEMLATFVVDSHFKSQPKGANQDDKSFSESQDVHASAMPADPEILPQQLLKKYITYAKLNIFPRLQDADMDKLSHVYAELRRESSHGQGVPIAVRHIESMIRMSEAHARMHLRQHVTQEDVDMAIRVLLESFISTQKFGVQKALQKSFRKYMTFKKDYNELLLYILRELVKNALHFEEIVTGSASGLTHIDVKVDDLYNKAQEHDIYDLKPFFNSSHFSRANFVLDEERRVIRHHLTR
ncbi:DNA replication licensing factor MCM2 [Glycine max]|nr:DNA replication licensing factor MCM2 [Glycine max]